MSRRCCASLGPTAASSSHHSLAHQKNLILKVLGAENRTWIPNESGCRNEFLKIVAEIEPFGNDKNDEDDEEEGVVEICVPDCGSTYNGKGEADVGGKDVAAGGSMRDW